MSILLNIFPVFIGHLDSLWCPESVQILAMFSAASSALMLHELSLRGGQCFTVLDPLKWQFHTVPLTASEYLSLVNRVLTDTL